MERYFVRFVNLDYGAYREFEMSELFLIALQSRDDIQILSVERVKVT